MLTNREDFKQFMDGVNVQMLIDRSIGNSNKGSKRWVNKLISCDAESYIKNVEKLKEQMIFLNKDGVRLYASCNSRDINKAHNYCMHKQIDLIKNNDFVNFYSKINDKFISILMKPENRKTKLFILDIDKKDTREIDQCVIHLLIKVIFKYETVKGWHYICEPFNLNLLEVDEVEIKTDGLLLIDF